MNVKQEILDALNHTGLGSKHWLQQYEQRLQQILETHTLEPIGGGYKFDLVSHIEHQKSWSTETFGPGRKSNSLLEHIIEEVEEVFNAPHDLEEWIDIIILALDGAWRSGHSAEEICSMLVDKQRRNEGRTWPDWRTQPEGQPIKHIGSTEEREKDGTSKCETKSVSAAEASQVIQENVQQGGTTLRERKYSS